MTTTINKKFELNEPIEKVWSYLIDPTKIVTCVPGATLTEKIDDRNFKGQVAMKLGPVKVKFNGEAAIVELDEAKQTMTLKGKGLDAKGKGSADMQMNGALSPTPQGTAVDFTMQISIVGKLATFGARLINEVTDQVLNQFIDNFKAKLAADTSFVATTYVAATEEPKEDKPADDRTTAEKAKAVSDAAAEVQKAVAEVQAAQDALSGDLQDVVASTTTASSNGVAKVKAASQKIEIPKAKVDNSLNGFSLMMAVVKGWFSKLFGGK